jgi:hypothetical protein
MALVLSHAQDSHKDLELQQTRTPQLIWSVRALMRLRFCRRLLTANRQAKAKHQRPAAVHAAIYRQSLLLTESTLQISLTTAPVYVSASEG